MMKRSHWNVTLILFFFYAFETFHFSLLVLLPTGTEAALVVVMQLTDVELTDNYLNVDIMIVSQPQPFVPQR